MIFKEICLKMVGKLFLGQISSFFFDETVCA